MTKKPRKSLFEELNSMAISKNEPERFVEQKGEHIISGAINLIEFIHREFDEGVAVVQEGLQLQCGQLANEWTIC